MLVNLSEGEYFTLKALKPFPSVSPPLRPLSDPNYMYLHGEDGPTAGAAEVLLDHDPDDLGRALVRRRTAAAEHLVEEPLPTLGVAFVPV